MLEYLFYKVKSLYLKETPTRLFTCEYCDIFEKIFYRTPLVAASKSNAKRHRNDLSWLRSSFFTIHVEHIPQFLLPFSIYCSLWAGESWLRSEHVCFLLAKNNILATPETRKGVTLYEVKHPNNVEIGLVLCCLSLKFYLASVSLATFSMYFVYWYKFSKVKTIVLAFIKKSRE